MSGPIIGAGSLGGIYVTAQATPQMHGSLQGWFQPLLVGIVTIRQNDDHEAVESVRTQSASGIIQPLSARALEVKPEGERNWKWVMLHCTRNLQLNNDDVVRIRGKQYRVMRNWGYEDYGYLQYELCEDFQPSNLAQ